MDSRTTPASPPGEQLLLGLEFADGRTATNLGVRDRPPGPVPHGGPDESQPVFATHGGSGGGRTYDQVYWLTPRPPAGPLVVVCAWPAFGIQETRTVVAAEAFAAAGPGPQVLWPWEPEQDRPAEPPEPVLPPGGWFADAVRSRRDRTTSRERTTRRDRTTGL